MPELTRYADAGVDRGRAAAARARVAELAATTHTPEVLVGSGPFAALWRVGDSLPPDPVLVSSTDSVGTKSKVAVALGRHQGIGEDLVNHCLDDVLTSGAKPLFFLDYFASSRLEVEVLEALAQGMAQACRRAGCALIGGETAEMPGVYGIGDYDLAGFMVGVASRGELLGPDRVEPGDRLLALASTGLHTNGYSLVRHVLARHDLDYDVVLPGTKAPLGELLLAVHASYLEQLGEIRSRAPLHALAHVTGGGIVENLPRVLPPSLSALVDRSSWQVPPLFLALQQLGEIPEEEMWSSFNMGVGMVCVVPESSAGALLGSPDLGLFEIGEVVPRSGADRLLLR